MRLCRYRAFFLRFLLGAARLWGIGAHGSGVALPTLSSSLLSAKARARTGAWVEKGMSLQIATRDLYARIPLSCELMLLALDAQQSRL